MAQLIVTLKGREIRRVPITKTQTKIGRDPSNDVVIDNVGVSRQHAVVLAVGDRFVVLDTGSANGLFVNSVRTEEHDLQEFDEINVGKFTVVFTWEGGVPMDELEHVRYQAPRSATTSEATYALTSEEVQQVMARARSGAAPAPAPPPVDAAPGRFTRRDASQVAQGRLLLALTALVLVLTGVLVFLALR